MSATTESGIRLLDKVTGPADLRSLSSSELVRLAAEIREFLVASVTATGGHLGSNLGMVELTIALHRVFHSPEEPILFDVGHQSYVHKIITGRRESFDSLRGYGGLSGYPSQAESEHDVIENSHASTALSYADGMARAFALRGEPDRPVVAVVGDGALTGGMCWEALNNIGVSGRPVVVVLNDNARSYEPTVGSIARHLATLRAGRRMSTSRGNMFEEFGLDYLGPVDGHEVGEAEVALRAARARQRPVVVHCVTEKGRGYRLAEEDEADRLHGVSVIDPSTGRPTTPGRKTWTSVFSEELVAIARNRADVVGITAAMRRPVGLLPFAEAFPNRVLDVGIAEQHAVTCAAGLALGGLHPVVPIYATFLNRAFDQVLMDVALHRLPVTFVLDRAGVTGPDGPSHHGMWDLAILLVVPGLRMACPRDASTLRALLREALDIDTGPTVVRLPKAAVEPDLDAAYQVGEVDVLRDNGREVLVVAIGATAGMCLSAADDLAGQGIRTTVVDPRWTTPVDPGLLELAEAHELVCTVEDGGRTGGAGTVIAHACADVGVATPVRNIGVPRKFMPQGTRTEVLAAAGLSAQAISARIMQLAWEARAGGGRGR